MARAHERGRPMPPGRTRRGGAHPGAESASAPSTVGDAAVAGDETHIILIIKKVRFTPALHVRVITTLPNVPSWHASASGMAADTFDLAQYLSAPPRVHFAMSPRQCAMRKTDEDAEPNKDMPHARRLSGLTHPSMPPLAATRTRAYMGI